METCKYGSGAGKRKPTAVKRKGVVCRAYASLTTRLAAICRGLTRNLSVSKRFIRKSPCDFDYREQVVNCDLFLLHYSNIT